MTRTAVVVDHLRKQYEDFAAVDDLSFEIAAGTVVAILGPNGAGKTTTLEILEGFQAASSGMVRVLGQDPLHAGRRWRSRIGLVSQATNLDPQLTGRELLHVFAAAFPNRRGVEETIELVNLASFVDQRVQTLSGGQQRRVDLALGIIGRPDLVFLDEPTTGLDPAARRQTWATVEALADGDTTVLLTTHYLEEAAKLADRVIVLEHGRCIADATPHELRAKASGSRLRYPIPSGVCLDVVPGGLRRWLDPELRAIIAHGDDVVPALGQLLDWNGDMDVDLSGLEVGMPSLEDAYLALTDPSTSEGF
jgi:ABC-2 type transport system ATP-binding protein